MFPDKFANSQLIMRVALIAPISYAFGIGSRSISTNPSYGRAVPVKRAFASRGNFNKGVAEEKNRQANAEESFGLNDIGFEFDNLSRYFLTRINCSLSIHSSFSVQRCKGSGLH